ncbi:hypothetical protein F2P56_027005 [Juglans regia]|uniref:Uncharacterized protein n=1 Tax=Juglans regia TaxID=51240 RepID=A0A833TPF5_JUGRE|nr:hypothetical protein F2P56_027005 [Juglans regia]
MKEMDHDEALQLFTQHAFKSDKPIDGFEDLIEYALCYAGGLPLALKVVGSNLYGEDRNYWKSELKKYKRIPEENIQGKLKISYDGLDGFIKKLFLDIACFFKGDEKEYVTKILESCRFYPYVGFKRLNDKCLITIDEDDRLGMHDLLQDMGREIVRQESPEEPGKRSRLWFHEDVREVLEKNKGTEQIEGISIKLPWEFDMIRLGPEVFAKMERLRILIVRSRDEIFCGRLNYLSNELRVLDWPECSLEFFPSSFHGEKLIDFNIRGGMIRDLGTRLQSKNLTSIDLSDCGDLKNISDLSSCSNLEKLILYNCKSLVEVHDSVEFFLDRLVELDFGHCSNLKNLPRSFKSRSLELLKLEGCISLEYFPEIECEMEHLKCVKIENTVIQELPSSITYLTGLMKLYMYACKSLVRLPIEIFQLEHLTNVEVINCPNFVNLDKEVGHNGQSMPCTHENEISSSMELFPLAPPESNFSLRTLNLSGSGIVSLPPCIEGFVGLSELNLTLCKQLKEILHLPPNIEEIDASGCSSLKNFLPESNNLSGTYIFSSNLRTLNLSGSGIIYLPPCIERFVGLSHLYLKDCKQLEEILYLPPNIEEVYAHGCSSLKNFLPESNNLSWTYNFSTNLKTLNLSGSGIIGLPPCIEGFVGLQYLYLEDCKELEEILHLPPNIEWVYASGCGLLERFPHVSTKFSFGTPDLKWLRWIDLSECNKVEVDVGNHAPDPLLVQERFQQKDSSKIIYPGSRIPEWFTYCKENTSYTNSIEIEIDRNAFMCGHQIMALVYCFVVGPLPLEFETITLSIDGQRMDPYHNMLRSSMDPHRVCLKYIAGNSIDDLLSRSYRKGNNMRFTFGFSSRKAIIKSVGVHLIYENDNFINPIQFSKRYQDYLEPDWNPTTEEANDDLALWKFKDANDDLINEDLDLEFTLGN